jgi:hypothetical protein
MGHRELSLSSLFNILGKNRNLDSIPTHTTKTNSYLLINYSSAFYLWGVYIEMRQQFCTVMFELVIPNETS